eukprot:465270-Amphidinium_carterae.1
MGANYCSSDENLFNEDAYPQQGLAFKRQRLLPTLQTSIPILKVRGGGGRHVNCFPCALACMLRCQRVACAQDASSDCTPFEQGTPNRSLPCPEERRGY